MLDFLFKTAKVKPDLSFLAVDMHSHLLPGLDDGLKELSESVQFIRELHELGYQKLICTPHILSELYPNSKQTILPKLELVQKAVSDAGINIVIEAAAEYMIDHEFSDLIKSSVKDNLLTITKQYILVEMSYLAPSPNADEVIFDLQMLGLTPILAHPERYGFYHSRFEQYNRFKELGCKLQVNFGSLSGGYGADVKKVAEKLFKNNLVDFIGTDMHHTGHLNMLKNLASKKELYTLLSDAGLKNKLLL